MNTMSDHNVRMMSSGPPETVLPEVPAHVREALDAAASQKPERQRELLLQVAANNPTSLHTWAALGRASRDGAEAYMAYRVGYHRGLDQLRANGWRGSGYVRYVHPSNRGFLDCLDGLRHQAAIIGESVEAVRCAQFLAQLDPATYSVH